MIESGLRVVFFSAGFLKILLMIFLKFVEVQLR